MIIIDENERLLAEAVPDGMIILDAKKQMVSWNQHAADFFQLSLENKNQIVTKVIKGLSHLFRQPTHSHTLQLLSKDNKKIYLSLSLHAYRDNGCLLIAQDITHTYHLEEMRQVFIANVSHELRTPLTVFRGCLELLLEQQNLDAKQTQEILQQMAGQGRRMENLVEDLLLLSKLEGDQLDEESIRLVAIAPMLRDIVTDAKALSGEQQHEFILALDENLMLIGQAEELRSAFSNLIYNAVHYTPAKGKITLQWRQTAEGPHLKITDTGIGIEKKHLSRITQRFYRVDKSRAYLGKGGTGLGLAIVKHVLLRHHAELNIESEIGKGSTFCCCFPPVEVE